MLKTVSVFVGGWLLILAGVAMLVLPGQGVLTIIAGVALLATRFPWARRLMERGKDWARPATRWTRARWLAFEERYDVRWPRRLAHRSVLAWRNTKAWSIGRWRNLKARWNIRGSCPENI